MRPVSYYYTFIGYKKEMNIGRLMHNIYGHTIGETRFGMHHTESGLDALSIKKMTFTIKQTFNMKYMAFTLKQMTFNMKKIFYMTQIIFNMTKMTLGIKQMMVHV